MVDETASDESKKTHRLFVGLPIMEETPRELLETLRKLRISAERRDMEIKWVPPKNLHVTLKFIGASECDKIRGLISALESAASLIAAFDLTLTGLGAFPEDRHARVIWAGVVGQASLLRLFNHVEEAFAAAGCGADARGFSPHLTLGRLRKSRSVNDLLSPFVRKRFGRYQVRELVLYESVLQGHTPVYHPLHRVSLSGPAWPVDQSLDQSLDQSIDQPVDQSIDQPTSQSDKSIK